MVKIKKGDVVQGNENSGVWLACLLIVNEVRSWGVIAGMKIPNQGTAYVRLNFDQIERIGISAFVEDKHD